MSPRKRARLIRAIQYAVLVAAIALLVVLADWDKIQQAFFQLDVARAMFPDVITVALVNPLIYTGLGFVFGLALAVPLALMRLSSVAPYRWIAGAYVEFFRGLPALLVILSVGVGVPLAFGVILDKYVSLMIALGIVASAYMAETLRAGIQAVPKGQVEAARSLGMSSAKTTVSVVIPQAFKIILPPLTNELILLTKDSSLALFLGASIAEYELTQFGRVALNQYQSLTPVLVAGLCYLIITVPLSYLSRYLERRTGGRKIKTPESTELGAAA